MLDPEAVSGFNLMISVQKSQVLVAGSKYSNILQIVASDYKEWDAQEVRPGNTFDLGLNPLSLTLIADQKVLVLFQEHSAPVKRAVLDVNWSR